MKVTDKVKVYLQWQTVRKSCMVYGMVPFSGYCCIRHVTKVLIISNKLSILFSILSLRMSRTPTTSR